MGIQEEKDFIHDVMNQVAIVKARLKKMEPANQEDSIEKINEALDELIRLTKLRAEELNKD